MFQRENTDYIYIITHEIIFLGVAKYAAFCPFLYGNFSVFSFFFNSWSSSSCLNCPNLMFSCSVIIFWIALSVISEEFPCWFLKWSLSCFSIVSDPKSRKFQGKTWTDFQEITPHSHKFQQSIEYDRRSTNKESRGNTTDFYKTFDSIHRRKIKNEYYFRMVFPNKLLPL